MTNNGWVKLHRKIIENPIFLNSELLQLFLYCILKAGHKEKEIIFNGKMKKLEIGSFITGGESLSKELKQNQSSTWSRLKLLKNLGYISLKSTNKFTVVSVLKYDLYQDKELEKDKPDTNKIQTKYKPDTTNKNEKNIKNTHTCEFFEKKFFGENKQVRLTELEYQDLVCRAMSKELADELIEQLDLKIESGNDFTSPEGHFARLKTYLLNHRKNQNSFKPQKKVIDLNNINFD